MAQDPTMRWLWVVLAIGCSGKPLVPPERLPPKVEPPATNIEPRRDLTVEMSPMSVVSTGSALVWTDAAGAIWTMPEGGTPKQLSDQKHPDFAFSLLLAGDQVFATARHGILRIELRRGEVTQLAITGLPDQPEEAVADAGHLYVTIFKHDDVMRIPVGGGKAERIGSVSRGVLGLAGSTLYIASYATGTLSALSTEGGAARPVAKGLPRPTGVAADGTHVFVYCETDRALRRIDATTGESTILARDLINSDRIVIDGDWIYTRSWGPRHSLLRIPKSGGPAQTLADDLRSPYRIAIDADSVYVTSRDDRRIVRLAKARLPRH